MKAKHVNIFILTLAALVFTYAFFIYDNEKPIRFLPKYGPQNFKEVNGKSDTIFHTVQDFSFVNQDGETVSQKNFENSIYVADFFFTTCRSICPIMSNEMERVYRRYKNNQEVKFLSHTVDPETDNVEQLKQYAEAHHADSKQWMLVTGNKKELYAIARTGYLVDAGTGNGGVDDFIHTQNFALIDKEKHIRGYYDGTNSKDIDQLIKDIDLLLAEYRYRKEQPNN